MKVLDYAQGLLKRQRRKEMLIYCYGIAAIGAVAIVILTVSIHQSRATPVSRSGPIGLRVGSPPKFDPSHVFDARVQPVLTELQTRDRAAVHRAIDNIHAYFVTARGGAPAFAAAIIGPLNSMKTTYLAGKGVFERWWYKDPSIQPVQGHVRWNYEQQVTSGRQIYNAVVSAVVQLKQDFRANRNVALQGVNSSLHAADLPVAVEVDPKQLDQLCEQQFEAAIQELNNDHAPEKAIEKVDATSILANTAIPFIIDRAVIACVGEAAVEAGGAVATGTAAGGAGGTIAEPGGGTVIGMAGGFLAGAAVDYWYSHHTEVALAHQVVTSLNQLEDGIINGDDQQPGIEKLLNDAASQQVQQLGNKLREQLTEAAN